MLFLFFFNDTATTEIYTLSLHDALPICSRSSLPWERRRAGPVRRGLASNRAHEVAEDAATLASTGQRGEGATSRSEEHTSELQSRQYLVCRLLLEKKKI